MAVRIGSSAQAARAGWRSGGLCLVVAAIAPLLGSSSVRAWEPMEIVVLTTPGVSAYRAVTDAFVRECRGRARVRNVDDGPLSLRARDVVVAVGQRALDAALGSPARIVSALALDAPAQVIATEPAFSPEVALRALKVARPSVVRLAVLHGRRTAALVPMMVAPARALGIEIVPVYAKDGPDGVRLIRRIAKFVDALYLAPDVDVIVPQLFEYAIGIEIHENLPVVAVTREQVRSGALIAVDAEPHAVGSEAAMLVNQLIAGVPRAQLRTGSRPDLAELRVNAETARRLDADLIGLRAVGARIE